MRHWRIEPGAAWQGYATRGARMLQGGQLPRQGTAEQQEPSLAELLDPVALEARLAEARVRRAEAIARRAGVGATESARPERRPLVGHDTLRKGAAGPPKNVEHLEARQLSSTPPLRAEPRSVAWASKTTVSFPKPKAAPSDHADSRFGLPAALPPAAERARPRAAAPWLGRHAGGMALVLGIAIGVVGTSAALLSVPPPILAMERRADRTATRRDGRWNAGIASFVGTRGHASPRGPVPGELRRPHCGSGRACPGRDGARLCTAGAPARHLGAGSWLGAVRTLARDQHRRACRPRCPDGDRAPRIRCRRSAASRCRPRTAPRSNKVKGSPPRSRRHSHPCPR